GTGSRRCPGQAFALRQTRIVLAEILRRFDVELDGRASVRAARQTITLVPATGAARVIVRARRGLGRRGTPTIEHAPRQALGGAARIGGGTGHVGPPRFWFGA